MNKKTIMTIAGILLTGVAALISEKENEITIKEEVERQMNERFPKEESTD